MNMDNAVRIVGKEAGITQADAEVAIKTFLGIIEEELYLNRRSHVHGLGTFSVRHTKQQMVCESFGGPKTKLLPVRQVVKFKASSELNNQIAA
jgi:nucleoid DNA-binding protein